ncbi:MAG TPA: GNAT family N-acetyltransferase [Chthoniobacterales bacterium]|jgi:GNAT superfamily N-acetyltransferase|nr:GNAT family N-acetyltransferase [Chthoniobacterales bacterium]
MKLSNWIKFTWDLGKLPAFENTLPEHYEIGPATAEDEKELRKIISSSFFLDPAWSPEMNEVAERLEQWLDGAFASASCKFLALRHGARIIGASVVSSDPDREVHLIPGPCISIEYRNRGFGTRLLEQSLSLLRETGLSQAAGLAKENLPVSKFLYPKFDSSATRHDPAPLVAA